MIEWFLGLHPALLLAIAIVAFATGILGRSQCTQCPKYQLPWIIWSSVAGLGFGVGLGLSCHFLFFLLL